MSSPDYVPLSDDELDALEYFVDSALAKGVPSMVRRLVMEVRQRRAVEAQATTYDIELENPPEAPVTTG